MKNNFKPGILAAALLLCMGSRAQEGTTSGGGVATGSGGSASYSAGQVVYVFNSAGNGSEWQGVQQAYELQTTGVSDPNFEVTLAAFPNPASSFLELQVKNFKAGLLYSLFDAQGKQIDSRSINAGRTQLDLRALPAATYLLSITQEGKPVHAFKIIKK
jgi:hypothetical protein